MVSAITCDYTKFELQIEIIKKRNKKDKFYNSVHYTNLNYLRVN